MRVVIAITGASGVIYGRRLAEELSKAGAKIDIVVSDGAKKVMDLEESGGSKSAIARLKRIGRVYSEDDMDAPFASGSNAPDAFVVCPCSMKTLAGIANGYSENLITRGAEVA
jgi:4-hydroxy-3-polyprenylbenzoate decarboxylase